jgi:hypothetical protein
MQLLMLCRQLLANLWSRHAALQCAFNQESIDFLLPLYRGSINKDAIFDPEGLSGGVGQVKFKAEADTNAEEKIRPLGIHRDLRQPQPYLALLLELGNESKHKGMPSKVKLTFPKPLEDGAFGKLVEEWYTAVRDLEAARKTAFKEEIKKRQAVVKTKQRAMDLYNRYTISIWGASPEVYGILKTANIETQFQTLLAVTMPSPKAEIPLVQEMKPLEHLDRDSAYTTRMLE